MTAPTATTEPSPPAPAPRVHHVAMALGLLAGLGFGLLAAATGSPLLQEVAQGIQPLGTLFVRALQMVVIPLVVAVLFLGVAGLGDVRRLGRLGGWALGFVWASTAIAIVLGMATMRAALAVAPVRPPADLQAAPVPEIPGFVDFLLRLVPANPFAAASEGALLPLIVFTVLFAAAAASLAPARRQPLLALARATSDALIALVYWILRLAPVGLFALAAPITASTGWDVLRSLAVFVVGVVVGLALFVGLVYLPALRLLASRSPWRFVRGSLGSITMGFSTTSSVASLPVLLQEARAHGIDEAVEDLVIPLAVSLNRAGSALFQGAAVVLLAALSGVALAPGQWLGAGVAVFLAAMTVAPVPSASVMTLAPALTAAGVPLAGLGLLLGIDRFPDMFRSATNVFGHLVTAAVVDGRTGGGEPDQDAEIEPP
ncbi:MAG TPA: dicarboxylate/amino acid:cation symporter [Thermoanaerobaculia bacterium]|nr:dicarboxylate/amino acid:cation symporter [Thermoanaerobaculia bacterium]